MKHTLESLLALAETDEGKEQICIIVAEAVGFEFNGITRSVHCPFWGQPIPLYHTSLDAIMPEVRKLDKDQQNTWLNHMCDMLDPMGELGWQAEFMIATANPIHHCIALLLTLQA